MEGSKTARDRTPKSKPHGHLTHRDVVTSRAQHAHECTVWAAALHEAVMAGIDEGISDALLESGVQRILELEKEAEVEAAKARVAAEARVALAAVPIKTPVTKQGSAAAKRAASAGRLPLGEGSLVQLKNLDGVCGLSHGCFDVNLEEFNGRKGRVSKQPPPWVIKAVGCKAGEGSNSARILHDSGGLVPVLLDSRSTDADRHRGVWVAVPPANLKVLGS